ncbi:MAG: ATP-binding protein [Elusimicrobiota bacterium]
MNDGENSRLLKCLFADSDRAFVVLDREARMQAFSAGVTELTDHPIEELRNSRFSMLFADGDACAAVLKEAGKNALLRNCETIIVHKNGGHERVFMTLQAIEGLGHLVEITPAVEDLGSAPDSRTIQETLVKMERFSAVGRMTAAFAHEMRTPIHVIASTAELMLGEMPEDAPQRESIDMILRNAQHANLSIRALLEFSKVGKSNLRKGSINDVFRATLQLVGKLFEKQQIEVEMEMGEVPEILMDSQNMRAVVHSLLINAVDAMPEGGKLRIKTEIDEASGGTRFSIQDTGIGMSAEALRRIGSAFFTTKEDGTGLGLYLTKRVLAEHGAEITFASAEGEGSTVTIDFPANS